MSNLAKTPIDPLLTKKLDTAYALIEDPERPGMYFAVRLKGVVAAELEHIEFSQRSSYREWGLQRLYKDMQTRHRQPGGWGNLGGTAGGKEKGQGREG